MRSLSSLSEGAPLPSCLPAPTGWLGVPGEPCWGQLWGCAWGCACWRIGVSRSISDACQSAGMRCYAVGHVFILLQYKDSPLCWSLILSLQAVIVELPGKSILKIWAGATDVGTEVICFLVCCKCRCAHTYMQTLTHTHIHTHIYIYTHRHTYTRTHRHITPSKRCFKIQSH